LRKWRRNAHEQPYGARSCEQNIGSVANEGAADPNDEGDVGGKEEGKKGSACVKNSGGVCSRATAAKAPGRDAAPSVSPAAERGRCLEEAAAKHGHGGLSRKSVKESAEWNRKKRVPKAVVTNVFKRVMQKNSSLWIATDGLQAEEKGRRGSTRSGLNQRHGAAG